MRLLVLFTRLSGYLVACLEAAQKRNISVSVVAYPKSDDAPFGISDTLPSLLDRSRLNGNQLADHLESFSPDAILTAGWIDKTYLRIAKRARTAGCVTIAGCDTQYTHSLRQCARIRFGRIALHRSIDAIWVAGDRQRHLANQLGYSGDRCWHGYYSCDLGRFHSAARNETNLKEFLYVGRIASEKGIGNLLDAYARYREKSSNPWGLRIVGNGPLVDNVRSEKDVSYQEFTAPSELPEIYSRASAFVLASTFEPWGVVLHEAAAAGLPIIASHACGATVRFLAEGANGYGFEAGNVVELADRMSEMSELADEKRASMSDMSRSLAAQLSPEIWVNQLVNGVKRLKDPRG